MTWLDEAPHLTGQEMEIEIARWIRDTFQEIGLDHVSAESFPALLSYPDPDCPNKIEFLDTNNAIVFSTVPTNYDYSSCSTSNVPLALSGGPMQGKYTASFDYGDGPVSPYSAYSPRGSPEGTIVYANFGRDSDFKYLRQANVDISSRIAIIRTGAISLASKVLNAQKENLAGIILYADPEEVAPEGQNSRDVIPDSIGLPGNGVQLGHVHLGLGDPLSPGWTSAVEHSHRHAIRFF